MSNRISTLLTDRQAQPPREARNPSNDGGAWPLNSVAKQIASFPKTSLCVGLAAGVLFGWWVKR